MDDTQARELVARVEGLLADVDTLTDPAGRQKALEAIAALVDLYGEGLGRVVEHVAEADQGELRQALAGDELVAHLLLLHGLHPVPVADRVREALASVRPYLDSHGGDVELLAIADSVVRLRLEGSCNGCPSSTVTLKNAIENAIRDAAPEVEEIVAEGAEPAPGPQLLQIECPSELSAAAER